MKGGIKRRKGSRRRSAKSNRILYRGGADVYEKIVNEDGSVTYKKEGAAEGETLDLTAEQIDNLQAYFDKFKDQSKTNNLFDINVKPTQEGSNVLRSVFDGVSKEKVEAAAAEEEEKNRIAEEEKNRKAEEEKKRLER